MLFTDLVDSTQLNQRIGDDEAREIGREIESMSHRAIESNRGVLIKEMGDGLMAAFPSARRAVVCAQEIQSEMRRFRTAGQDQAIELRIGLHTGEVIAEGGDIHGETVIIAKRIEGLAPPGGILVSDILHSILGSARDELTAHGEAELKGIEGKRQLYLVPVPESEGDRIDLADSELTPYVGRDSERDRLQATITSTLDGRGQIVFIGGAAGLGKSRLVREVEVDARRQGLMSLTGYCVDMEHPPPYKPFIDQLEKAMRVISPEAMRSALGENAPEVAKLMPALSQRYDDIPAAPELNPEQERQYMLHGVAEFLERAARTQPLMLIFEDLHWADESTLLLIRHMATRAAEVPLLVVGTYRSTETERLHPFRGTLQTLTRDHGATDVGLQLLDRSETAAVLEARAGRPAPKALVDLVEHETQGNPFFVEEVYRHLRESGRLFSDDGSWMTSFSVGDTEVPSGVRFVIGQRLEQMDPDERRLLALAAVIGRTFSFEVLATTSRADEDDLFDSLETATRMNLVEEFAVGTDARYTFVHEQIRQTLLGELALPRRQRLHVRIAEALEGRDASGFVVEVAHHLLSAGPAADRERTVASLLGATEQAVATLAFEDALGHLANAHEFGDVPDPVRLATLEASALRGSGRVDDAVAVLGGAIGSADGDPPVELLAQRVSLLLEQYRAGETFEDIDTIIATSRAGNDQVAEAEGLLARGRAHYIMSLDNSENAELSRQAYLDAYETAKAYGDKRSMALALMPTTWFTDYWSDYRQTAKANVIEALALAEEIGDEDLILEAKGLALRSVGVRESLQQGSELLALLEIRRDPVRLNAHCFWMMWAYLLNGRFQDCVDTCDRGLELAAQIGTAPVQYGAIKAIALADMGRFDEVEAALAQEVTDDGHPFGQAVASHARSVYLHRLEAWEPAARSCRDTMRQAVELSRLWMQGWTVSLAVSLEANLASLGEDSELFDWCEGYKEMASANSRAERLVLQGDGAEALAVVGADRGGLEAIGELAGRDQMHTLEIAARSYLQLGQLTEAEALTGRVLARAGDSGYGSAIWRLRSLLADVLDEMGQHAEAETARLLALEEFRHLAALIDDSELRAWFERQPMAPG